MDRQELSQLLRKIRKFEKEPLLKGKTKIAVIGSYSIQYFVKILRYFLAEAGWNCEIYEGEYNGIYTEICYPNSKLHCFSPDYVLLLPFDKDIKEYPALLADEKEIRCCLDIVENYYRQIWEALYKIGHVKILQANIVLPPIRSLGNLEYQMECSTCRYLEEVNRRILKVKPPYVTVVDVEHLSRNIGKYQWFDYPSYFLHKEGVRLEYMPELVSLFVSQLYALEGKIKKCLVLDLDNTLWGGVVGDDGWDGIQLDPNHAVGEAYQAFQQYLLMLKERGVILAVCSKNEEATAKEPFEKNEHMLLHQEDISCFMANWEDKASNIRKIAEELNIGTDSIVFFDDNPAERDIVRRYVPEVHVVEVPKDPAMYVLQMEKESPFEWLQVTEEDLQRTSTYQENRKRRKLQENYIDYREYLKALKMRGTAKILVEKDIERFVQLINKSNQFNLRTVRYLETDIREMLTEDSIRCIAGKISDRYSQYGIISCIILKKKENICEIDTWVMSCRVLKRGVEYMMFCAVLKEAAKMGCTKLTAEYRKSKKNHIVEEFYEELGFQVTGIYEENGEWRKEYVLDHLENTKEYEIEEEKDE